MNRLAFFLRYAVHNVLRKPLLSGSIVASMGISIGALLCILTLCYLLIVQPLPYQRSDELYVVSNQFIDKDGEVKGEAYTYPGVLYQDDKQNVFSDTATMYYSQDVITSLPSQPAVNSTFASPGLFKLLGVPMHLGRQLDEREKLNSFAPSAVISYEAWRDQFGSDPDILKRKLDIAGKAYSIVGVTAPSFYEPQLSEVGRNTDVWLPWDFNPSDEDRRTSWSSISGAIYWMGRLKSGTTPQQAEQLLSGLIDPRWRQEVAGKPFFAGWTVKAKMASMRDAITGDSTRMAVLLLIGVIGLTLISCVNISCLMMSRAAEQQKSMAIQASVGARMRQLFAGKLAEIGLLIVASTLIAFAIAAFGFHVLQTNMATVLPRVDELHLNGVTVLAAVAICVTLSLVFTWLSISTINYKGLAGMVQSGSKGGGLQLSKRKQQILIGTQVAIASFLIFCNIALFLNSKRIIDTDMGFKVDGVSRLLLDDASQTEATPEQEVATLEAVRASLLSLPGVEGVSQSGSPLASFSKMALTDATSGKPFAPLRKAIDQDYFKMIQQRLVSGRNFTAQDVRAKSRVMIVDEAFAKEMGGDPLKTRLSTGDGEPYEVIGVVAGIALPNEEPGVARTYTPIGLDASYFLVKTSAEISRETIVARLKETTGALIVNEYEPLRTTYRLALFKQFATLSISAALTVLIVLLSGLGIYGIVNNSVRQRRFELGTRIAIGAKKNQLVRLIARQNLLPIAVGVAVQLALLAAVYVYKKELVAPYVSSELLAVFAANLAIVLAIALNACYLPLRALFAQPPAFILRNE
ncbi:ABC transporter permease [Lysobacter enzymogenes]|uniref:ABC transporter permease n=1 Tax=Lysobacter enzymogenes TaxID=69 RepID=UPI001A958E26|nr:ABC transporter permease [Lysobacter enzymogenes]QQP97288.1 ABC transporter permease [Lysobacter enzymogenes]